MKKLPLTLLIAASVAGFSSLSIAADANNLIQDPQFSEFRANQSKSDVWVKDADKNAGKGDVGSSKDTAFGDEGSARFRFIDKGDDFSATPGIHQQVTLEANSNYEYSFYMQDSKGENSISQVEFGVLDASGKPIKSQMVHIKDLASAPKGEVKKSFRQVKMDFNSGSNTSATVYAKLHLNDGTKISSGDIGKQTEVRVDEFKLIKK